MLSFLFAPAPLAGHARRGPVAAVAALARAWSALRLWYRRRATVQRLSELDDRMLKDIGLARGEIEGFVRTTDPYRGHRFPARDRARFY